MHSIVFLLRATGPERNSALNKRGIMSFSKPKQCISLLQVSGNTLQHLEMLKFLGVVFTSDGRRNEESETDW